MLLIRHPVCFSCYPAKIHPSRLQDRLVLRLPLPKSFVPRLLADQERSRRPLPPTIGFSELLHSNLIPIIFHSNLFPGRLPVHLTWFLSELQAKPNLQGLLLVLLALLSLQYNHRAPQQHHSLLELLHWYLVLRLLVLLLIFGTSCLVATQSNHRENDLAEISSRTAPESRIPPRRLRLDAVFRLVSYLWTQRLEPRPSEL